MISVIIPCYNEEDCISETYRRITNVCKPNFSNYELIFTDDGSTDKTSKKILDFANEDEHVKVILFSRNFGQQAAVSAGLKHCTGDYAFLLDADLQDPPELFLEMLQKLHKTNSNIVYGKRKRRDGEKLSKKITSKLYYLMLNMLSEVYIPHDTGDFRIIDRKVIDAFNALPEKKKYVRGLVSWVGFKQEEFLYDRDKRFSGDTKWTYKQLFGLALKSVFYFSKKPLRLATTFGSISIVISFLLLIYVLLSKLIPNVYSESGWASIMIAVLFLGGVQLFTIGILSEYIGNIFEEVKNRPEYIVSKRINFEE